MFGDIFSARNLSRIKSSRLQYISLSLFEEEEEEKERERQQRQSAASEKKIQNRKTFPGEIFKKKKISLSVSLSLCLCLSLSLSLSHTHKHALLLSLYLSLYRRQRAHADTHAHTTRKVITILSSCLFFLYRLFNKLFLPFQKNGTFVFI